MKWAGAALSLLLAACTHLPYKPQITAPATTVSLERLIREQTAHADVPEQLFLYSPTVQRAYFLSEENTLDQVAANSAQYCQIMWNEDELYDVHTHPVETEKAPRALGEMVLDRINWRMVPEHTAKDKRFIQFTPSVNDIAALVKRREQFYKRKRYNKEDGRIRFFIATNDEGPVLVEYALKKTGTGKDIVDEYTELLKTYRQTTPEEFRRIVNEQSKYLVITLYRFDSRTQISSK